MTPVLESPKLVALSQDPVRALALSRDGTTLVLADTNRQVALWRNDAKVQWWDLQSDDERFGPIDIVRAICLHPREDQLAVAIGRELRLLDVESGAGLWSHMQPHSFGFMAVCPQDVDFSESGAMVATFDDGCVTTWMPDGSRVASRQMADMPLTVQFLADGSSFFGAGRFRIAKFNLDGTESDHFTVPERIFAACYFERQDRVAVRTLEDVEVWEFGAEEPSVRFHTASGAPTLAGCESRQEFAYADQSGVWLVSLGGERSLLSLEFGPLILCLRYALDGTRLYGGLSDGRVVAWNLAPAVPVLPPTIRHEDKEPTLIPSAPSSLVLAIRIGAVVGLLLGMILVAPLVTENFLSAFQMRPFERFVTTLWLSFCLGSPFLFLGMGIGWIWGRNRRAR